VCKCNGGERVGKRARKSLSEKCLGGCVGVERAGRGGGYMDAYDGIR